MIDEPNCSKRNCRHLIGVDQPNGDESIEVPVCEAYPDGIPDDVAWGKDLHLVVRPDQDNDVVYEEEK